MKRLVLVATITAAFFVSFTAKAQDTLPKFNIRDINNQKILITWINPFKDNCVQLSVQRSYDSTHFFSTIYSAQSPELPQNGVTDSRMPKGVKVFYRIFYVLLGGDYYFTNSVGLYSFNQFNEVFVPAPIKKNDLRETGDKDNEEKILEKNIPIAELKQKITIYRRSTDTIYQQIEYTSFPKFRDSVIRRTKDTLFTIDNYNIILKPFVPKPVWKPSTFVFSSEETNRVTLHLPQAKLHKYKVAFFDPTGDELFQIKQPKDDVLILDNTNFMKGGWYYFDLYVDDKLKEHSKFYLAIPF